MNHPRLVVRNSMGLRRCLQIVGLFTLVAVWMGMVSSSSFAQQRNKGFLESCDGSNLCLTGLQCAKIAGSVQGICAFECIPGSPQSNTCPNGEPCSSQLALPGVCYCLNNNECNKGACAKGGCRCVNGQCVGTRKLGETCDEVNNACDIKLKCASVGNTKRCLPLCLGGVNGPICDNRMPCVGEGNFSVCKCTDDAHCRATGANFFCRNGVCVNKLPIGEKCTTNAQCENGLVCAFDDRTATQRRCLLQCRTSQNLCIGGETCKQVGGSQTVCRCDRNAPCPNGEVCENGLCSKRDRCSLTKSCPTGTVCISPGRSDHGVCVKECRDNKACESEGNLCTRIGNSRACFCSSDGECSKGQKCIGLKCVKGCKQRTDCTFPQFCRNGGCQPPNEGDDIGEPPAPEQTDGGEATVKEQKVREPGPESKCQPGCKEGEECDETTGTCKLITYPVGKSCTKPEVCDSKLCVEFKGAQICTQACTADGDCEKFGLRCVSVGGQSVCHFPEAPPVQETDPPTALGCCEVNTEPSLLPLFFVVAFFLLLGSRRRS